MVVLVSSFYKGDKTLKMNQAKQRSKIIGFKF